jgi:hypothetical protein
VSSSGNDRITIKENPEWVHTDTGHVAALRALLKKIGRNWCDEVMCAGTLNQQGHQVWVTVDNDRAPRSDTPPEPIGVYHNSLEAARADEDAKPGAWIVYREYSGGKCSYAVVTEREKNACKPSEWKVWGPL